jgi:hypothetical protein
MVIAMVAMRMMQTPVDDVVDVIAVRDRLVPTAWTMHVAVLVAGGYRLPATFRVGRADLEAVLVIVHLSVHLVRVVQVAIMQIVEVVAMTDGPVAAAGPVYVVVIRMGMTGFGHCSKTFVKKWLA